MSGTKHFYYYYIVDFGSRSPPFIFIDDFSHIQDIPSTLAAVIYACGFPITFVSSATPAADLSLPSTMSVLVPSLQFSLYHGSPLIAVHTFKCIRKIFHMIDRKAVKDIAHFHFRLRLVLPRRTLLEKI